MTNHQQINKNSKHNDVPGLKDASSFSEAFVACLKVLVDEEEKQHQRIKQTLLVNGEKIDANQSIYSFIVDNDLEIIEGSRVKIHLKQKFYEGYIVSISNLTPRVLWLKTETDLGERIAECKITEDISTLHKALLARYEKELDLPSSNTKWLKKIGSDFAFADRVLINKFKKIPFKDPINADGLNSDQYEFISKALEHDISFLWGPPGTGKTKCMSGLISIFYDIPERTIIGSNTNQAVDQVLLKLCRDLVSNGRISELYEGKIIRVGYIQNAELSSEFGDLLDLEKITERKSHAIKADIIKLETQVAEASLELKQLPAQFKRLDAVIYWQEQCAGLQKRYALAKTNLSTQQKRQNVLLSMRTDIQVEIQNFHRKGFFGKLFGPSLNSLETKLHRLSIEINETNRSLSSQQKQFDEIGRSLSDAKGKLSELSAQGQLLTLTQLKAKKRTCEATKQNATGQLKTLQTELEKVSQTVLDNALVYGATLTKIFLNPQKIGKCDNLILDEASMAILPDVHFASSLAKKRVIISGDFRQIPPILTTNNDVIHKEIGKSIFDHRRTGFGPIKNLFLKDENIPNMQMLEWQYRMPQRISNLVSDFAYNSKLKTAPINATESLRCPDAFDQELIVVDTSTTNAHCDVNSSGSRSNALHAIIAERIVRIFTNHGSEETIAFCSPFRAQKNLVQHTLNAGGLASRATVGTVHVLQGDEKDTIIFDTVDGIMRDTKNANYPISRSDPDTGQSLTVAVSRAKRRLIILANLDLLNRTLPRTAFVRKILEDAKRGGNVLSSEKLLPSTSMVGEAQKSFYQQREHNNVMAQELSIRSLELTKLKNELTIVKKQISEDLEIKISKLKAKEDSLAQRSDDLELKERNFAEKSQAVDSALKSKDLELQSMYANSSKIQHEAQKNEQRLTALIQKLTSESEHLKRELGANAYTLVQEKDFAELFEVDALSASHSLVIYSGFVSVNRVRKSLLILKKIIKNGVRVRVVVKRTPGEKYFSEDGKTAIQMLKEAGVKVDLRAEIHQKAVLIDDDILWIGSLNPLSYNENLSDETMLRIEGGLRPLDFARSVALRGENSIKSLHDMASLENPICHQCNGDMEFSRKYKAAKFTCVNCETTTPLRKVRK